MRHQRTGGSGRDEIPVEATDPDTPLVVRREPRSGEAAQCSDEEVARLGARQQPQHQARDERFRSR